MSICKQCIHFARLNEDLINGHHPNCPFVNEKRTTIKISAEEGGSGYVTHDISEIVDLLDATNNQH